MGRMLTPRLREMSGPGSERGRWLAFWCPGCDHAHAVPVEKPNPSNGALWHFDGDVENPTLSPSLHLPGACHLFIRGGDLQFLSDCTHPLAGQTVPMPDWPRETLEPDYVPDLDP